MKASYKIFSLLFLICFFGKHFTVNAHSVQVAYCVNCNGDLRLYVEHWHAAEDPNTTSMTIQLSVGGVITSQTGVPSGQLLGVPFGGLPGCATPATVFGSCAGSANTYNDWVYYDFPAIPSGVPITITVISGSNVFTEDGCGMYPAQTVEFTIPVNVAPTFSNQTVCGGQSFASTIFNYPTGTTWTNSNPAIGLAASGSGNIPVFVANTSTTTQTGTITVATQCYTTTFVMSVNPAPNPAFSFPLATNNIYCRGSTIPFTITDASNINTTSWTFGDGGTASVQDPSHTYSVNGTYVVQLNVTPSVGTCTSNSTQTLTIYTPTANFNFNNACLNSPTDFTSISTSPVIFSSYIWDFGDGSVTGNGATSIHTYTSINTYTVNLIVTDVNACKDSISIPVTLFPIPIIAFSSNTVCLNVATSYINTSSVSSPDNIVTWAWDFDNNGTTDSGLRTPTNTYTAAGNYNVELKAITNNGCKDSLTIPVKVNALPIASFNSASACLNTNVVLNNTSTIAAPDNIATYNWNFGVGSVPAISNSINPTSLVYTTSGIKNISLNLITNTSCTATATQTIEIYPQPVANFSTTSVCQSTATAFTDLSTPTGSVTVWEWDFTNNGSLDDATNAPTNIYSASGTFSASLIVTDNNSCKDTVVLPLNVWGHTIPDFSPDKVCFGTSSAFTNLTDETTNANVGVGTTYIWNFADGSLTSNLNGPSHTYTLGGNGNATYNVTLTATSLHNCIDSVVKVVNVYSLPTASFTSDSVCLGSPSQMIDASNGNGNFVNTYVWDFLSDGSIDIAGIPNPNFVFPAISNNNVTYTVSTSPVVGLICSNTTNSITVWVNPNPIPDFTFVNKCINAQPNTFDGSTSMIAIGNNTAYTWAYGDGVVSTPTLLSTSTHSYLTAGIYNTTLTLTSNKGCQAAVAKQVEVYEKPHMIIANSSTCDQIAMTFTAVAQPNSGILINWYWDFNNVISTIEGTGQTSGFTFSGPGAHTIALITETNQGCRDTLPHAVYINYVPVPLFNVDKPNGCPIPTHCVNFTDITLPITGPAQIKQWQWTLGDGTIITNSASTIVPHCYINSSSSQLAEYDVQLVVTTDSGCVNTINKLKYITVYPKPIANYVVNPNPGSVATPLEYFTNQSQDYTKWWWNFGDNSPKDSVNIDPTHFYSEITADTYYSLLLVENQYGCTDTAYVPIEIAPDFTFYIPNAFTPSNEDGINDFFTGVGIGIAKYEMWIFDRWGEMIFYTDDIEKGWNGKVREESPEGKLDVYTWKVKLKDVLGKKHDYIGHVTLL